MASCSPRKPAVKRNQPMRKPAGTGKPAKPSQGKAVGVCACGAVRIEIDVPAFWAWHDHSKASQRAQGCAYATYIGVWRSRFRIVKGAKSIARFTNPASRAVRSFCVKCGTPLLYERDGRIKMVNIPRALFDTRTGREPRYHLAIEEAPDWAYRGEPLAPLKGYPGVMMERVRRKKRDGMF
jgi:hypothetical protein